VKYVFLIAVFSLLISCKKEGYQVADTPPSKWNLVWADEFDYTGLPDPEFWDYEVGYVRNDESQYYMPGRLENSRVEDGRLIITALPDGFGGYPVTSASVITYQKMDFHYGRMEVRAKMPKGKGAWPAIWTLGINRDTIGWPRCGEIDILEWLGWLPKGVWGSVHYPDSRGNHLFFITGHVAHDTIDLSEQFHVYAMEWDSTRIHIFLNDIKYATYTKAELKPAGWEPFTKPHYLLLNLAMGGISGGPIDESMFPFVYEIDYVRYFTRRDQ
jgi:beta-glucanase (GH16 family)